MNVRLFQPDDEPRVLELMRDAFGQWPRRLEGVAPSMFFRWKHTDCPFGPSVRLVACADGAPIGFLGQMPWSLRCGERVLSTMRGVDLAVDPAHRRRGVSMSLLGAARAHYSPDVAFAWSNPNEYSRGGVLKAPGRRKVNGLPRFVGFGEPLRAGVRRAARLGSERPPRPPVQAPSAAAALADGERIDALLANASAPEDRLTTAVDLDFLRWRYGQFEDYRALAEEAVGGRGAGVAIFRVRAHERFDLVQVCELLLEHDDRRTARRLLRSIAAATHAELMACAFRSSRQAVRCGFLRSPRRTMLTARSLREHLRPDPALPASWALSVGDLELL